jgi:nucleoside 2-deoxyribosyltransferase
MTKPSDRTVFVSHASADQIIVESFFSDVLSGYLGIPENQILYTSQRHDDTTTLSKNALTEYVQEIIKNVQKCKIFIVILTANYIDSQACQNELGAAFALEKPIYVFKDNRLDNNHDQFWLRNRVTSKFNKAGIAGFTQFIENNNLLPSTSTAGNLNESASKLETSYKKYKEQSNPQIEKAAKVLVQAITNPNFFHEHHPIIIFANRNFYINLSIQISRYASEKLIWTIHKSPLLVESAYTDSNFLTEYDKQFATFNAEKIRLVIFENREEARNYKTCNLSYHQKKFIETKSMKTINQRTLEKRKKAFEDVVENNNGKLYFTTVQKVTDALKKTDRVKPLLESRSFRSKGYRLDYEFGFVVNSSNEKDNFGFTTGFNSQSYDSEYDSSIIKHIAFYSEHFPVFTRELLLKEHRYKLIADIMCQLKIVENTLTPRSWENKVLFGKDKFSELLK